MPEPGVHDDALFRDFLPTEPYTPPVFDPDTADVDTICNGDPVCEALYLDATTTDGSDTSEAVDLGEWDVFGDSTPVDAIGFDIEGVTDNCDPGSEEVRETLVTREEYRCESGVAVEETQTICQLYLVHEIEEDYIYECPVERDEQGNLILSAECEILDGNPDCTLTSSECTVEGGTNYNDEICRSGDGSFEGNVACARERGHELRVRYIYECAYVWNPDTATFEPDADCATLIGGGCVDRGGECSASTPPETETIVCEEGFSRSLAEESCSAVAAPRMEERPVYTVYTEYDGQDHVPSEDYLSVEAAGCALGVGRCVTPAPVVEESLVCQIGVVETERLEVCEAPLTFTFDDDYVYEATKTWDAIASDHVGTAEHQLLEASCDLTRESCAVVTEPTYDYYQCAQGYSSEYVDETCEQPRLVTVDTDYVYVGRRSWDEAVGTHQPDSVYAAASMSVGNCEPGPEYCEVDSPGVWEEQICERGYVVEDSVETVAQDLLVVTDTDYRHSGLETWSAEAGAFQPDAAHETLSSTQGCSVDDRVCTKPGSGVFSTHVCDRGYRIDYAMHACSVELQVGIDHDYRYNADKVFDWNTLGWVDSAELAALKAAPGCMKLGEACTQPTPPPVEEHICRFGSRETLQEIVTETPYVVEVDTDYVYSRDRSWSSASSSHVPESGHAELVSDATCRLDSSVCSVTTPPAYDRLVCEQGYRDVTGNQSCVRPRVVTVDTDYRYTVDRDWDVAQGKWVGLTDWNAVRNAGSVCVRESQSCTRTSPGVYSDHYCERGYSHDDQPMECNDELSFTVDRDYRYVGYDTWNGSAYAHDATLTAIDSQASSKSCVRESRIGDQPHANLTSTYKCEVGDVVHASSTTCDVPLNVTVTKYDRYKYSATTGSSAQTYVHGRSGCALKSEASGRRNYECTTTQSYQGVLSITNATESWYKYDVSEFAFFTGVDCNILGTGSTGWPVQIITTYACRTTKPTNTNVIYRGRVDQTVRRHHVKASTPGETHIQGKFACNLVTSSGSDRYYNCLADWPLESLRYDGLATYHNESDSWDTSACSAASSQGPLQSEVCIEGAGTRTINGVAVYRSCWKKRRTYGSSVTEAVNSCAPPSGYSLTHSASAPWDFGTSDSLVVRTYSKTHALSDAENVVKGIICHKGWWRDSGGTQRSVDSCTSQISGATLVSQDCVYRESGSCRLYSRSYRKPEPGPADGYNRYKETWRCEEQVTGTGVATPAILKHKDKWVWDTAACQAARASMVSGSCQQYHQAYVDASRSKTVDGVTITRQWTLRRYYDCQQRNDVDTCGTYEGSSSYVYQGQSCSNYEGSTCTRYRRHYKREEADPSGGCHEETEVWRCEEQVSTGTTPQLIKHVASETFPMTECNAMISTHDSCTLVSSNGDASTAGTRTIDGLDVYRSYWEIDRVYSCTDREHIDTCSSVSGYELEGTSCLWEDAGGSCRLVEYQYRKELPDPTGGCSTYTDTFICEERNHGAEDGLYKHVENAYYDHAAETPPLPSSTCKRSSYEYSPSETRTIDGLAVTARWSFFETHNCPSYETVNTCPGGDDGIYIDLARLGPTSLTYTPSRTVADPTPRTFAGNLTDVTRESFGYRFGSRARYMSSVGTIPYLPGRTVDFTLEYEGVGADQEFRQHRFYLFYLRSDGSAATSNLVLETAKAGSSTFTGSIVMREGLTDIASVRPAYLVSYLTGDSTFDGHVDVHTATVRVRSTLDSTPTHVRDRCVESSTDGGCAVMETTFSVEVADPSGGCGTITEEWTCEEEVPEAGTPVGRTGEVDSVWWDESSCQGFIDDGLCELVETNCTDANSTRIIDGVEVTQPCWSEARRYECGTRTDIDTCSPPEGSTLDPDATVCLWSDRNGVCRLERLTYLKPEHDPSGGCDEYTTFFWCEDQQTFPVLETRTEVVDTYYDPAPLDDLRGAWDSCSVVSGSEVCIEPGGTRIIDGIEVTQPCWSRTTSHACERQVDLEGCQEGPGTREVSSSCIYADPTGVCRGERVVIEIEQEDPSGGCHVFAQDFRCEEALDASYEPDEVLKGVLSDIIDNTECQSVMSTYDECRQSEQICIEGPETRVIDGLEVHRACWKYRSSGTCETRTNIDTCDVPAGYAQYDSQCLFEDWDAICRLVQKDYRIELPDPTGGCTTVLSEFLCEDPVDGVGEPVDTKREVATEEWDTSSCPPERTDNSVCSVTTSCLEGAETRIVEGVSLTRQCWRQQRDYNCTDTEAVDTCDVPTHAIKTGQTCLDERADGSCRLYERTYEWVVDDGSGGCHVTAYDAVCEDEVLSRAPDTHDYRFIAWDELSPSCDALEATHSECRETYRVCNDSTPRSRKPTTILDVNGDIFTPQSPDALSPLNTSCWGWDIVYECATDTPRSGCPGDTGNCSFQSETCRFRDFAGNCIGSDQTYQCDVEGTGGCIEETHRFVCDNEVGSAAAQLDTPLLLLASSDDTNLADIDLGWAVAQSEGSQLQPVDHEVDVISAFWSGEACGPLEGAEDCVLVDTLCAETGNGNAAPVRLAQDDYHQTYVSDAPAQVEACWEQTRVYSCSVASDVSSCPASTVDACQLASELCLVPDGVGGCHLSEYTYRCEAEACSPSTQVCDERMGNPAFSGEKYLCSETVKTTYHPDFETSSEIVSFTCAGLEGCSRSLLHTEIDRYIVDVVCDGGRACIATEEISRRSLAYYCDASTPAPDATHVGYVEEGFDAATAVCSEIDATVCSLVGEQCVTGSVVLNDTTGEQPRAEYCEGLWRRVYDCQESDAGSACTGECQTQTRTYTCDVPVDGVGDPVATPGYVTAIVDDSACQSLADRDDCAIEETVCVEGPETRLVDGAPIYADCWAWDRRYRCAEIVGESNNCQPDDNCVLDSEVCLAAADDGTCLTTEHIYICETREEVVVADAVASTCEAEEGEGSGGDGSGLIFDDPEDTDESGTSLTDAVAALRTLGQGADEYQQDPTIFGGDAMKCSKWILGTKNCCKKSGLLIGLGCSEEEEKLAVSREEDLCLSVGSYCSSKSLFGTCLKKKETYCCYKSTLSKIVIETAMVQQGLDLGTPKDPSCEGLSVEQFQLLNLADADFSAVADDILGDLSDADFDSMLDTLKQSIDNMTGATGG